MRTARKEMRLLQLVAEDASCLLLHIESHYLLLSLPNGLLRRAKPALLMYRAPAGIRSGVGSIEWKAVIPHSQCGARSRHISISGGCATLGKELRFGGAGEEARRVHARVHQAAYLCFVPCGKTSERCHSITSVVVCWRMCDGGS